MMIDIIELFVLDENTWNHLTVRTRMNSFLYKNNLTHKLFSYVYIYIYIYNKSPETMSLVLFKLRIYETIQIILQEC